MKSCLSWERAIRVFGFNARAEASASGWPDALTPQNIVRLQYPREGSDAEMKRALRNQNALSAAMKKSFSDRSLLTVERIRKEPTLKEVTEAVPRYPTLVGVGWGTWANRDFSIRQRKIQVGEHDATYLAIEAHAFRAWLSACGEEPSEHVRAWFAARLAHDADTEESHQDNAAATSKKPLAQPERPKVKRDYVMGVIDRVAAYCEERKIEFDRHSMPGKASDLLWVMGRLYPDQFEGMPPKTFQDHYKGVCSWPRSAAHQDGARSIYLGVFPEARAQVAGVLPICK